MQRLAAHAVSLLFAAGCLGPDEPEWRIRFEAPADAAASVIVRARILEGGCAASTVLHEVELEGGGPPPATAPLLAPGRYGFEAEAVDAECRIVASGCQEHDLPIDGDAILVTLASGPGTSECAPGTCNGGRCDETTIVVMATGRAQTCAASYGGDLSCWGRNAEGQVGDGTFTDRWSPVPVASDFRVSRLSAGGLRSNWEGHSCAISAGAVHCWGYNAHGQVGDGTTENHPRPTRSDGIDDASRVSAGGRHTCAVRDSGAVMCWGHDDRGQLGDGPGGDRQTLPVAVVDIGNAVDVAAGEDHTCARHVSGSVLCWGGNDRGQLGLGDVAQRDSPSGVDLGGAVVVDVAAGAEHSCVVTSDGRILCWGANDGLAIAAPGTVGQSPTPLEVAGVASAVEVALGSSTSCARLAGGSVLCWGENGRSQVGNGTTGGQLPPTPVSTIDDALDLDFGYDHGCVRRASGRLYCWGRNQYGRLGIGNDVDQPTAVYVLGPPP